MQKKTALFFMLFLFILCFIFAEEGAAVPSPYDENGSLYLGNPSCAESNSETYFDNFLTIKNGYALSYNNSKLIPNWVSWHLEESDLGDVKRKNDFPADTDLPEKWYAVKVRMGMSLFRFFAGRVVEIPRSECLAISALSILPTVALDMRASFSFNAAE